MYNVAVVGATGNVGRKFLEILEERNFPIKELFLFASKKSQGKIMKFKGQDFIVEELCEENIKNKKIDFALFSAGGDTSLKFAPTFAKEGAIVIDVGTSSLNGKITGDVLLDDVIGKSSYMTKVPGGVGALTTTLLMKNVCEALK